MTQQQLKPDDAFAELGRIKLAETDLEGVLTAVAKLAHRTLPGADDVSVTLVRGPKAQTAIFLGAMSLDLDETQYQQGHGPCLDAARGATSIYIADMAAETRWPDYTPFAVERGAAASLSVGLPVQGDDLVGALNIYATTIHPFNEHDIAVTDHFAGYAAVALANANLYDSTVTMAQQMELAMKGRAVIEQAKGILMGERRCSAEEAFAILVRLSQDTNRKLRDVAAALVETAQAPAHPAQRHTGRPRT